MPAYPGGGVAIVSCPRSLCCTVLVYNFPNLEGSADQRGEDKEVSGKASQLAFEQVPCSVVESRAYG